MYECPSMEDLNMHIHGIRAYFSLSPPLRMLTLTKTPTGSTVELNWFPPLHPNGAIHYEIEYEPAVTPGDPVNAGSSSSLYFTLTLPNEFLTYTVRVVAVNGQWQTSSSVLVIGCTGPERGTQIAKVNVHFSTSCTCLQLLPL